MSKWQTVNEALDLILDCSPGEDENIQPGEIKARELFRTLLGPVQKLSLFQLIEMSMKLELNRSVFTRENHILFI